MRLQRRIQVRHETWLTHGMRGWKEKEQVMANPNEINPGIRGADIEEIDGPGPEYKIRHLTRRLSEAKGSGTGGVGKPAAKVGPDDRKSEARPSAEPPLAAASASSV